MSDRAPTSSPATGPLMGCRACLGVSTGSLGCSVTRLAVSDRSQERGSCWPCTRTAPSPPGDITRGGAALRRLSTIVKPDELTLAVADYASQVDQVVLDDVEDQVGIHSEILVHDDVARARDRRPGNGRAWLRGRRAGPHPDGHVVASTMACSRSAMTRSRSAVAP